MKFNLGMLLLLAAMQLKAQVITIQSDAAGKKALFKDGVQKSDYIYDWLPTDADLITQKNFPALVRGKWIFLNQKLKCITDSADYLDTSLYFLEMKAPIRVGRFWNVVSMHSGFFLDRFIPDSEFYYFEDEELVVRISNGRAFYAPKRGKWVEMHASASEEVYVYPLQHGERINFDYNYNMARFRREKYGFVDREGHIKIQPVFEKLGDIHPNGIPAQLNGKFGFIDTTGAPLCPFDYEDLGGFSGSYPFYAAAKLNGKYGYLDTAFQWRIKPEFDYAGAFYNGFAMVTKNGLYGLINSERKALVPIQYKYLRDCYSCLMAFDGQFYKLISYANQTLSENYKFMDNMYNGLFKIQVGEKYGLIDDKGKILLPAEYDQMESAYPKIKITKGAEVKYFNTATRKME